MQYFLASSHVVSFMWPCQEVSTCSLSPLAEEIISRHERENVFSPSLDQKCLISIVWAFLQVFMARMLIKRSDLNTELLKTINHKLMRFGCCYIAIVTAPLFSPLIRLMEPNALTHAAGYEFLVPLMDSEDITALPSLSGTSFGQSERQAVVCNHSDKRTSTDCSSLGKKTAWVRVHSRRRCWIKRDVRSWRSCVRPFTPTPFSHLVNMQQAYCISFSLVYYDSGTRSCVKYLATQL